MNANLTRRSHTRSRNRGAISVAKQKDESVLHPGPENRLSLPLPHAFSYTVADACRMSGIGRTLIYKLAKNGRLQLLKAGGRTLVTGDSLRALIKGGHA